MSKVVKIPDSMSPFVVIINGVKQEFPAGVVMEVPDNVAEIIAAYEKGNFPKPKENAPKKKIIDDSGVGTAAWSSQRIVEQFCPKDSYDVEGITCDKAFLGEILEVATYPIDFHIIGGKRRLSIQSRNVFCCDDDTPINLEADKSYITVRRREGSSEFLLDGLLKPGAAFEFSLSKNLVLFGGLQYTLSTTIPEAEFYIKDGAGNDYNAITGANPTFSIKDGPYCGPCTLVCKIVNNTKKDIEYSYDPDKTGDPDCFNFAYVQIEPGLKATGYVPYQEKATYTADLTSCQAEDSDCRYYWRTGLLSEYNWDDDCDHWYQHNLETNEFSEIRVPIEEYPIQILRNIVTPMKGDVVYMCNEWDERENITVIGRVDLLETIEDMKNAIDALSD